jgi:hypothetical protein
MTNHGTQNRTRAIAKLEEDVSGIVPPSTEINAILLDYYETVEKSRDAASSSQRESTPISKTAKPSVAKSSKAETLTAPKARNALVESHQKHRAQECEEGRRRSDH